MNCYHLLWIPSFSEWMVLKYIPPWLRSHLICGLLFIYFLFICSAKIYQEHIMCQHFTFRKWWEEIKKKKKEKEKEKKENTQCPLELTLSSVQVTFSFIFLTPFRPLTHLCVQTVWYHLIASPSPMCEASLPCTYKIHSIQNLLLSACTVSPDAAVSANGIIIDVS